MPTQTVTIHDVRTIKTHDSYHGWPTLTRRRNGQLLLVASGGRDAHVCPFGQVRMYRSDDDGRTWRDSELLVDGPLDDRDAGVLETSRGTLIVVWFTSMLAVKRFREQENGTRDRFVPEADMLRWREASDRIHSDEVIQRELGVWAIRSEDGGNTWSDRIDTVAGSPHGPIELADGRLLYTGKQKASPQPGLSFSPYSARVGAAHSTDDGRSWQWIGDIPTRAGDDPARYHELHQVEAADGRIIAQIRNYNEANRNELLQTHSLDGGRTWAVPYPTGIWGLPAFLSRLPDGRLMTSFGHRRDPLGNYVSISEDHGQSWSTPLQITESTTDDMGYPSTVRLDDGSFLTAWYDKSFSPRSQLRIAHWALA